MSGADVSEPASRTFGTKKLVASGFGLSRRNGWALGVCMHRFIRWRAFKICQTIKSHEPTNVSQGQICTSKIGIIKAIQYTPTQLVAIFFNHKCPHPLTKSPRS